MSNWQFGAKSSLQTREAFVAGKIREAILRGHFKPGEKIDQNAIADLLNVSRSPVRDALRTLAAEGLVKVYPHRAAVVAELSSEELRELCFLRGLLEGIAARAAVSKLDDQQITILRTTLAQLNTTTDLDQWLELNRRFHNTIYQAAKRPRLLTLIESLRRTMTPYIRQNITTPEHLALAQVGHQRIYEACVKRDERLVEKETKKHLKVVYDEVLAFGEASSVSDSRPQDQIGLSVSATERG